MGKLFNKKEETNLNEAVQRQAFVIIFMTIFYVVRTVIIVYAHGGFKQFSETFPFLVPLIYIMVFCLVYAFLIGVLGGLKEKNKTVNRVYNILNLPTDILGHYIFIPFKRYVWPYLIPILVYFMVFAFVFTLIFLPFLILDPNVNKRLLLITYLVITVYATIISYAINFIFRRYIRQNKFIEFKEGKNEKEKMQNYYLYELGFNNNKKAYEIAIKYLHQDNIKVIIYFFYFIIIFTSSVISFGGFVDGSPFVENMFKVLLASLGTYICFERIVKHKNLFDVNGKILENNAVLKR